MGKDPDSEISPALRGPERAAAHDKAWILLVDDEPLNIKILEHALQDEFRLRFATGGEEALRMAAAEPMIELILLDVVMEPLDGFEVCTRLKASPVTENIPIIFLTSLDDPASEERGFQMGAVDYIHKPFSASVVRARVRVHVELQERTRELHRTQALLRMQASHDELTGLANRRSFHDKLRQTITTSRRYDRPFAVLAIDLDHFKPVNDTYGHAAGDQVLKTIAQRFGDTLRDVDTLARVGGDEFSVILAEVDTIELAHVAAQRFLRAVDVTIPVGDAEVTVGASIGIAMYRDGADGLDELLARADAACYRAKGAGRNTVKS